MPITIDDVKEAFTTNFRENLEIGWDKEGKTSKEISNNNELFDKFIKQIKKENEDFFKAHNGNIDIQIGLIVNLVNDLEKNGSFLYQINNENIVSNLNSLVKTRKLRNFFNVYNPNLDDKYGREFLYNNNHNLSSKRLTAKEMLNEIVCSSLNIYTIMISVGSLLTSKEVFEYMQKSQGLGNQLISVENPSLYPMEIDNFFEMDSSFSRIMKLSDILESFLRLQGTWSQLDKKNLPIINDGAIGYIINGLENVFKMQDEDFFKDSVKCIGARDSKSLFMNKVFKDIFIKYAQTESSRVVLARYFAISSLTNAGLLSGYVYQNSNDLVNVYIGDGDEYLNIFVNHVPLLYLTEKYFNETKEALGSNFTLMATNLNKGDIQFALSGFNMNVMFRKKNFPEITPEKAENIIKEVFTEIVKENCITSANMDEIFYNGMKNKYREDVLMNLLSEKDEVIDKKNKRKI